MRQDHTPVGYKSCGFDPDMCLRVEYGSWDTTEVIKMPPERTSKQGLLKRLARIEGQIRGIQRMLEAGWECESVITQLVAARSAIDGVASLVLRSYMNVCFKDGGVPDRDNVESLARAIAIWGRVDIRE
jgi:DNA-binding FrmR family transcriptional regulator